MESLDPGKKNGELRKPNTPKGRLKRLLSLFEPDDKLLILIQPDPDSIASALVLKRVLLRYIQKSVICCNGEIQRLDNQAMVSLLKAPLTKLEKISPHNFNRFALLDAQPHHNEVFSKFEYDLIIDHHPINKQVSASFLDIRPEYGATATVMTEYLRAAKIKPNECLSTAILYAIKTDTRNFERDSTMNDVEQFKYVYKYANRNLLTKIEYSEIRAADLTVYSEAFRRMTIYRHKKAFVYLGKVDSPDICVQIADFCMRVHMISWSFVAGLYNDKVVVILRSDGLRKNAGALAARAFAPYGSAGGHKGAARAEMPLNTLKETLPRINGKYIEQFIKERLKL